MIVVDAVQQSTTLTVQELVREWRVAVEGHRGLAEVSGRVDELYERLIETIGIDQVRMNVGDVIDRDAIVEWCDRMAEIVNRMLAVYDGHSEVQTQYLTAYLMKIRDLQRALLI